jgi:hypothetical protein
MAPRFGFGCHGFQNFIQKWRDRSFSTKVFVFTAKTAIGSREINNDLIGIGKRYIFYIDIDG